MKYFSKNLLYLREVNSLKQFQIEGFTAARWSNYELNKSVPNLAEFCKIAAFFEVNETDLLHKDIEKGNLINKSDIGILQPKGNPIRNPLGNPNTSLVNEPTAQYNRQNPVVKPSQTPENRVKQLLTSISVSFAELAQELTQNEP